jgi:lipid-binding SYLF domain-containing protein
MQPKLRKVVTTLAALAVTAVLANTGRAADSDLKTASQQALQAFEAKDPSLKQTLDSAAGYAIFPSIGEGAFIVGGAHGKGLVFEKGKAIGEVTMTKATIGAQAGGQSFSELIVFQTPEALRDFKSSDFEMSAGVTAVVSAEGASQNAKFSQGVAVFTLPKKGAMAAAAVGGQKFKFEPFQ